MVAPPDRIGSLPAELQEMVFCYLGWELRTFVYHRNTSVCALEALWAYHAAQHPQAPTKNSSHIVIADFALRQFAKPAVMHAAIDQNPKLSMRVRELTLIIPASRDVDDPDDEDDILPQVPASFSYELINDLLMRCTQLRTLRLIGFAIPRDKDDNVPFMTIPWGFFVKVPPGVSHLLVEEVLIFDRSTEEDYGMMQVDGLWCELSDTINEISGLEHIKTLHYKLPAIYYLPDGTKGFIGLESIRVDIMTIKYQRSHGFDELFEILGTLPALRVLDLRYPYRRTYAQPFMHKWHQLMPQVRVFRLSFLCCADAILSSESTDSVHFELLLDSQKIIDDLKTDVSVNESLQDGLESQLDAMYVHANHYFNGIRRLRRVYDVVLTLGIILDKLRKEGKDERRSLSILPCQWSSGELGGPWFVDEEEREKFERDIWDMRSDLYESLEHDWDLSVPLVEFDWHSLTRI